ncbi:DNA-binding transcriptional regulator, LysR family [Ferrimonas sediminum]|uniref:DNA-binding transcriptional regulator, LysR family n=1 Tax=Ferrimonas sediminum TaxID=718193 RepID=A0A1G8NQS9_9GAMM|nr:LysR family transcriptional regulator [Ferrimonas sediminum]SDI82548.1 DNA-binding transcriptional regulator, LysR family [Ferrimonas sediminum]
MDLLKSIRIFRAVLEQQSFSAAASSLNLVPSAVSRQVSELERHLGVQLLQRTTRSVRLTDEGQRYLAKMESICKEVDGLYGSTQTGDGLAGTIRLVAPVLFGQSILPTALAEFGRENPGVAIELRLLNRQCDLVQEGYDFAIRTGKQPDADVVATKLTTMRMLTGASPGYLALNSIPKHPADLADHNCLINNVHRTPRSWLYQEGGHRIPVKVDGDFESNDSLCIRAQAQADRGVVQLADFQLWRAFDTGALRPVLSDYEPPAVPVWLLHPAQRFLPEVQRALMQFLCDYLKRNPLKRMPV